MRSTSGRVRLGDELAQDFDDQVDERALVVAAQADQQHFGAIYDRYVAPIYRYCYVRLGSRQEAEDATSEVFLKALVGLHTYRGGTFGAWIYRIARNSVIDSLRRRRPDLPLDLAANSVSDGLILDQGSVAQAEQDRIRQHVATLPDDQRVSIELQLAGWSDIRISTALGKSVDAVKKLRFRAIRRLRRALAAEDSKRRER